MPMFYSHSTGYVDDVSPMKGGGILKGARTQILVSDAGVRDIDQWETAMLRSSYPDADANPKEAAEADKREARLAAGLKKFALMASAKQGKTTKLWNAAANDEITTSSIGHMHPSEPAEIARLSPEAKIAAHKAHVTNAKHMSFHPMSWLHHQRAPAVASHSSTPAKMAAAAQGGSRFQSLWNAGANDDVEGVFAKDDSTGFHPLKWLANQHDRTEMNTLGKLSEKEVGVQVGSVPSPGRVFSERANHGRNFEGSYVEDNSIGIKVDEMKGGDTMLMQLPVRQHLEQVDVTNQTAMEAELDRLIDMSTGAYNSLPPAANPVVRGIATDVRDPPVSPIPSSCASNPSRDPLRLHKLCSQSMNASHMLVSCAKHLICRTRAPAADECVCVCVCVRARAYLFACSLTGHPDDHRLP